MLSHSDPLIRRLHQVIRICVRLLAVLMVLVIATALMAMARKVIVLDLEKTEVGYLYGIAAAIAALGVSYWLLSRGSEGDEELDSHVIPSGDS